MRNVILAGILSLCLTGCFEFNILVKVNKDGSGTVEQKVLMSKAMIEQMEGLAKSFGTKGKNDFNLIDKKKLKKEAESMGKGVRFSTVKPISTPDQKGYIAYYMFNDINTLMVTENPSGKIPGVKEEDQPPVEEPVKFSFKPGSPAVLTVRMPEKSFAPDSASAGTEQAQAEAADTSGFDMMIEMMKGFRMSFALQVDGTITETNAANVEGSRITLVNVDFEQLLRNREKFKEISMNPPKNSDEMKKALKDVPGIKMELAEELTVQFK